MLRHRRRYDLLTVTTIPPVIMGVAARVIKRLTGIPFVYHCMDLYPEVAEVAGLARNRLLLRLARRLDTTTCRRATAVVVLSQDMRATLLARGLTDANIVVCNNFDLLDEAADPPADVLPVDPDRFRVTFAGNLGRFQGLEDVVDAAAALCAERADLDLVFLGSGVLAEPLRERAGPLLGRRVHFLGQQPVAAAALALAHSQLAVVSLRPGMYRVAYPSKTMTCLAAGCRLLVVVEDESELAALVRDEDLGTVCPPGDVGRAAARDQRRARPRPGVRRRARAAAGRRREALRPGGKARRVVPAARARRCLTARRCSWSGRAGPAPTCSATSCAASRVSPPGRATRSTTSGGTATGTPRPTS